MDLPWTPTNQLVARVAAAAPAVVARSRGIDFGWPDTAWHRQNQIVRLCWLLEALERVGARSDDATLVASAIGIDAAMVSAAADRLPLSSCLDPEKESRAATLQELRQILEAFERGSVADAVRQWRFATPAAGRAIALAADSCIGLVPDLARLEQATRLAAKTRARGGAPDKSAIYCAAATIELLARPMFPKWLSDDVAISGPGPELYRKIGDRYEVAFTESVMKNLRTRLPDHPAWDWSEAQRLRISRSLLG